MSGPRLTDPDVRNEIRVIRNPDERERIVVRNVSRCGKSTRTELPEREM